MTTFKVIIHQDEDGRYIAQIPALQYCVADGATIEEALENIQEAMEGTIQTMQDNHIPLPQEKKRFETIISYPTTAAHSHRYAIA